MAKSRAHEIIEGGDDMDEILKDFEDEMDGPEPDLMSVPDDPIPKKRSRTYKGLDGKETRGGRPVSESTKLVEARNMKDWASPDGAPKTGPTVTLKELAHELGTEPKTLRRWLRRNGPERSDGRWEWQADDPNVQKIKDAFRKA